MDKVKLDGKITRKKILLGHFQLKGVLDMSDLLTGSDLTRAILGHSDKEVWCAVSNESDKQAITAIKSANQPCVLRMVSLDNDHFICKTGNSWQHAVPVKRVELTQSEVGL